MWEADARQQETKTVIKKKQDKRTKISQDHCKKKIQWIGVRGNKLYIEEEIGQDSGKAMLHPTDTQIWAYGKDPLETTIMKMGGQTRQDTGQDLGKTCRPEQTEWDTGKMI